LIALILQKFLQSKAIFNLYLFAFRQGGYARRTSTTYIIRSLPTGMRPARKRFLILADAFKEVQAVQQYQSIEQINGYQSQLFAERILAA
jgi:hypothetical protein